MIVKTKTLRSTLSIAVVRCLSVPLSHVLVYYMETDKGIYFF